MRLIAIAACMFLLCFSVSAQEIGQVDYADQNVFGVIEGFWLPDDVCELGAGWERIIFDWAQHQPEGSDSWNTLNVDERWLNAAAACNREVIAIVKNTPAWATDGTPGPGLPRGLYLPIDAPENLWANFMRRAAEYYASRGVHRFIIWNEPDIERGTYGFEFEGTLDDYFQLLKVAALAARQGNPNVYIHIAGTTYWHDVNQGRRLYVDRLLERILADPEAEANGYYFDAVNLHIYFRTDTVRQIVSEFRAILDRYGMTDKHIWIAETNASPNLDPQWQVDRPVWQVDLDQQAAFLVQAAASGLASGADHIGVYKFFDWSLPVGAESFGLLRADGSRRPAFDAWHNVIEQFNGVHDARFAQADRVDVVLLEREDDQTVLVAWARTPDPVMLTITASDTSALLLDQYGDMMNVHSLNGVYTLMLPGAVCRERGGCPEEIPVGGNVSILIQPSGELNVLELTPDGNLYPLAFN